MNKLTKGAIAAAAGIVLLMGGAGSLAYWSDSVTAGAQNQTISAGQLKFGAAATGAWYLNDSTVALTAAQLSALRIVPGDKVEYKQTVPFTAQGNNLRFQATVNAGTWGAATAGNGADVALAGAIQSSAATSATVTGTGFTNTGGVYSITGASGNAVTGSVAISVSFTFPDATTGSTGSLGNVKLNANTGVVTLAQIG